MTKKHAVDLQMLSFDDIADILVSEKITMLSPAELHGLVCGQLAGGSRLSNDLWLQMANDFLDIEHFSHEQSKVGLVGLYQQSLAQFEGLEMSLDLLLPDDDDYELSQRVESLGLWVQGFLAGFGTQGRQADKKLSEDAKEMLNDLAQISQVASVDLEEDDDSENNFIELSEYVRMGAVYIFTECNKPVAVPDQQAKPTLH
ncbi:MAG: UPF0149 family protein [Pseudomonadales bacterium]|nr:UPF0149 family protein [Pseudomonadales bacterium]NRA18631.1 UPF0149 family protein [Oceanospirillaceae bacterium]